MSDSLDALLQKLVLDARQRDSEMRKTARPTSPRELAAMESLDRVEQSLDFQKCAYHSEQGARDSQEDRYCVIPDLKAIFPELRDQLGYFAVFDGHEGAGCAINARSVLHSNFVRSCNFPDDVPGAFKTSFLETDRGFLGPPQLLDDPLQLQYTPGCTACVVLVDYGNRKIYTAHAGDSRALLVKTDGSVVQLTRDHTGKTLSPEEKEDIKKSGVAMVIGNYIWMSTGGDSQRINRHSVSLEVSRALGDPLFKHGYNPMLDKHGKDIITAVPEITVRDFASDDLCILLASDGLFKAVSNERAAEAACTAQSNMKELCELLVREAIDAKCGDNTTVVAFRLN